MAHAMLCWEGPKDRQASQSFFALIEAASAGNVPVIRRLLAAGACVNYWGAHKCITLLSHVIDDPVTSPELVTILVEAGAGLEAAGYRGQTPLGRAVERGALHLVRALLRAGANPNACQGPSRQRPLSFVSGPRMTSPIMRGVQGWFFEQDFNRTKAIVAALAAAGADVNARVHQRTLLYSAVEDDDIAKVEALVQAGADVNARSCGAKALTPLMACKDTSPVRFYLLSRPELDFDALDGPGMSALEGAEVDKQHALRWTQLRSAWCGAVAAAGAMNKPAAKAPRTLKRRRGL